MDIYTVGTARYGRGVGQVTYSPFSAHVIPTLVLRNKSLPTSLPLILWIPMNNNLLLSRARPPLPCPAKRTIHKSRKIDDHPTRDTIYHAFILLHFLFVLPSSVKSSLRLAAAPLACFGHCSKDFVLSSFCCFSAFTFLRDPHKEIGGKNT